MFDKQDLLKLAALTMPFGKYRGRLLIDLPEPCPPEGLSELLDRDPGAVCNCSL